MVELEQDRDLRRKAAAAMVKYGTVAAVAEVCRVDQLRVREWMMCPEWSQDVGLARLVQAEKTDAMLSSGIEKALMSLEDRLDNGDVVGVNGEGEPVRQPIKARDAAIIAAILVDKRNLLRGQPTAIRGSDRKLNALAEQLRRIVAVQPPSAG